MANGKNVTDPLYARVKQHIRTQIASGIWTTGTRIPSENELVESFHISRMTANRALKELTEEGFLKRVPGVGTFVKEMEPAANKLILQNIADEVEERGNDYSSALITREKIVSSSALATEFEWEKPGTLYHLVLVHSENGVPVQLENRWVNPAKAADFLIQNFIRQTPSGYLLNAVPIDELEQSLTAILPNQREQELLKIPASEPCLALHRRAWSEGAVVTVATFIYPSSRYAFHSRYTTQPKA